MVFVCLSTLQSFCALLTRTNKQKSTTSSAAGSATNVSDSALELKIYNVIGGGNGLYPNLKAQSKELVNLYKSKHNINCKNALLTSLSIFTIFEFNMLFRRAQKRRHVEWPSDRPVRTARHQAQAHRSGLWSQSSQQ